MTSTALPPSLLTQQVERALKSKLVPIVRSSPGLGKSDILRGLAKKYGLYLIDIRLSQADVTDLNGFPFRTEDGRAEFLPFKHFPVEGDEPPEGYKGWLLFFDELTSAPKQIQAAAYKILLDREIGFRKLDKRVAIVAAGNKAGDNAVTHEISTALQSRLIHLEMRADLRDWITWAVDAQVDSRIIAFLEWKPELLHSFDPNHDQYTYTCPRTWWFTNLLIQDQSVSMSDLPLLAGTISTGPAMEFITFCEIFDSLPKIADILKDPENTPVPTELSTKYAAATSLAEHFSDATASDLVTYLNRFPVEFRIVCMRLVDQRLPNLKRNPDVMRMWQSLIIYMN